MREVLQKKECPSIDKEDNGERIEKT
jgi:hypothetical protein